MMGANLAVVHAQVPERNGVQVTWRNLQFQGAPNPSDEGYGFVRVGSQRAHPALGMETDLPAVGELGLVLTLDEEVSIWVCSVPWQDNNAISPGLTLKRHDSGVISQINASGECQLDFPGGICIRTTIADEPLIIPTGSNIKDLGASTTNWMAIDHPSGLSLKISPLGDVDITGANGISMSAVAPISIQGFGTFNLSTLPMADNPNAALDWGTGPNGTGMVQPVLDVTVNSGGKLILTSAGDTDITATGALNITSTGTATLHSGGSLNLNATGTVNLQGGGVQFAMAAIVDWATSHTHSVSGTSATGGAVTGTAAAASTPPSAACKSSSALQGLHA